MKLIYYVFVSLIMVLGIYLIILNTKGQDILNKTGTGVEKSEPEESQKEENSNQDETQKINQKNLAIPIAEFKKRITKKPFGIYITPQNSPVQPEKFTGYHTGVDIEYDDIVKEVPVLAISDGKVVLSRFVSGYGGTLVINHNINEQNYLVLYGHLDPQSMMGLGEKIKLGQQIGVLGDGNSNETDGERKHLHFGIINQDQINLKGYVNTEAELIGWINPLEFY